MKTLRELLEARKGDKTIRAFAYQIGLPLTTLHLFLSGERDAGVDTLRRLAQAFPNDNEMRAALVAYALGETLPTVA